MSKVDYDYDIAFVTDYMIADEDSQALQSYFEANAEDLNGDGEVHVQIQNYVLPPDDAQAVSYTHLDVYKRQLYGRRCLLHCIWPEKAGSGRQCSAGDIPYY